MSRDIIEELGSLALATRLKNLSDRLAKDVAQVYKESSFEFEPRWFTLIYALKDGEELAVTELATALKQTHPAVNQVANVLVERGLVSERKDKEDQTKRLLQLTAKGLKLVEQITPLWNKIKQAKEIIISRMAEPPSLQQLADEVQMPINRLKEGFKQIYGDSVFSFLLEYKMEVARQLLASGTLNVNEVGLRLGYSTASHFIAAFKKRYGTTPKKFTMGQTV